MKFTLQIDTDGAAVTDFPEGAIARVLRKTADKVEGGQFDGMLIDDNGNTIGSYTYNEE